MSSGNSGSGKKDVGQHQGGLFPHPTNWETESMKIADLTAKDLEKQQRMTPRERAMLNLYGTTAPQAESDDIPGDIEESVGDLQASVHLKKPKKQTNSLRQKDQKQKEQDNDVTSTIYQESKPLSPIPVRPDFDSVTHPVPTMMMHPTSNLPQMQAPPPELVVPVIVPSPVFVSPPSSPTFSLPDSNDKPKIPTFSMSEVHVDDAKKEDGDDQKSKGDELNPRKKERRRSWFGWKDEKSHKTEIPSTTPSKSSPKQERSASVNQRPEPIIILPKPESSQGPSKSPKQERPANTNQKSEPTIFISKPETSQGPSKSPKQERPANVNQRPEPIIILPKPGTGSPLPKPGTGSPKLDRGVGTTSKPESPTKTEQETQSFEEVQRLLASSMMKKIKLKPKQIVESVKMTDELERQLQDWENKRSKYTKNVQPLLKKKEKEFARLFDDYIAQLKDLIQQQGLEKEVAEVLLEEETKKFKASSQQLFGSLNTSFDLMEKEIASRKNLLFLEKRIILIQSAWRGYRVRKIYHDDIKNLKNRKQLAEEILSTEKTYASQLSFVSTHIQKVLQERAFTPDAILTSSEVSTVFSNIELLLNVSKELLKDLEPRLKNWDNKQSKIGDVFMKIIPFLKLYIQYVNNYDHSNSLHHELEQTKPSYHAFLKEVFAANPDQLTGLENYLILPVQRIPRYELLLKGLVKSTNHDHPDFKDLCSALCEVQEMAKRINESRNSADNLNKILDIEKKIGKELVQPHRVFLKEGMLVKHKSRSSGTIRKMLPHEIHAPSWFFLFNDIIVICQKSKIPNPIEWEYKFHDLFKLDEIQVEPLDTPLYSFMMLVGKGKKPLVFSAESHQQKTSWVNDISYACNQLKSSQATLKRVEEKREPDQTPEPTTKVEKQSKLSALKFPHFARRSASSDPQPPGKKTESPDTQLPAKKTASDDAHLILQLPSVPDFPSVPDLGPVSSEDLSSIQLKPTKLSKILDSYEKVFDLHQQLFKSPIDLQTLLPEYFQKIDPSKMKIMFERLQELKSIVEAMMLQHDHVEELFKNNKRVAHINQLIEHGKTDFFNLLNWASKTFPKNATNPLAVEANKLISLVVSWYLDLSEAWADLTEEFCCNFAEK